MGNAHWFPLQTGLTDQAGSRFLLATSTCMPRLIDRRYSFLSDARASDPIRGVERLAGLLREDIGAAGRRLRGCAAGEPAHQAACQRVTQAVKEFGFETSIMDSPILGAEGNKEFLLHAHH